MSNKYVLLNESITFSGAHVGKGEIVELPTKSAQALIDEGKALEAEPDAETKKALEGVTEGDKGGGIRIPSEDETGGKFESLDGIKKALDKQYKADDLKAAAKAADIQFAHDATKPEVINAVIAAGKAEELLTAE